MRDCLHVWQDMRAILVCVMFKDGPTLASIVMHQDRSALACANLGVHLLIARFVAKSENTLQDLHI